MRTNTALRRGVDTHEPPVAAAPAPRMAPPQTQLPCLRPQGQGSHLYASASPTARTFAVATPVAAALRRAAHAAIALPVSNCRQRSAGAMSQLPVVLSPPFGPGLLDVARVMFGNVPATLTLSILVRADRAREVRATCACPC